MASKIKIKKKQTEMEGRVIDLQRFAYDVFKYSALKFGVPEHCIRRWEGEENDYGCSDFILILSRIFLKYQITQRNFWYSSLKSRYDLNKLESFENIRSILQQLLKFSRKQAAGCVLHEILVSLSVINETILFLHSENLDLYFKELASFWLKYLAPMKKKFEDAGGLAKLYETYNRPKYDTADGFYDEFISGFCFPYADSNTLSCLDDVFHVESDRYFREISEGLPEVQRYAYYLIMHRTVWRDSVHVILSQHRKMTQMALEAEKQENRSRTDVNENPDLGIPPHELACGAGVSVSADAMLPQNENLPGESCQESTIEHRSTQKMGQKSKSGSRVEEDFENLNLDSSE